SGTATAAVPVERQVAGVAQAGLLAPPGRFAVARGRGSVPAGGAQCVLLRGPDLRDGGCPPSAGRLRRAVPRRTAGGAGVRAAADRGAEAPLRRRGVALGRPPPAVRRRALAAGPRGDWPRRP